MDVTSATKNYYQDSKPAPEKAQPKIDPISQHRQDAARNAEKKSVLSQKEMEQLIANLNEEISMLRTDLRFGFNSQAEMLQVSVIDTKTEKIIRRFPTEEAVTLMQSMKEFIGLLFDERG